MRNMLFRRRHAASVIVVVALSTFGSSLAGAQESAAEFFAAERALQMQLATPSEPEPAQAQTVVKEQPKGQAKEKATTSAIPEATSGAASGVHGVVTAAAVRNGVPPALLHGVIRKESNYRCNAYNPRGQTHGLGQVKAATARSVGISGSLTDCRNGAEAAARYLKIALGRGGSGCAGVSLYQRGVEARPACTAYGRSVMQLAGRG